MLGKLGSGGRRLVLVGAVVGLLLVTGTYIGSSNPADWTCTDNPLQCTFMGRVGIGTTPEWALDVDGNIHVPQGNYLSFINQGWAIGKDHNAAVGDEESLQIEGYGGMTWGASQKRTFQIISQTGTAPYTNHVVLQANLNDGKVGIGTPDPLSALHVNGNIAITGDTFPIGISMGSNMVGVTAWSIENSGELLVREHVPPVGPGHASTEITAKGGEVTFQAFDMFTSPATPMQARVDIGTSEPTWDLTFGKNSVREIGVETSDDNTPYDFKIHAGSGGGPLETQNGGDLYLYGGKREGAGSDGDVILAHSGQEAIGKVGIGTNSPRAELEVKDTPDAACGNPPVGYFGTETADKTALVGDATSGVSIIVPTGKSIGVFGAASGGTENWAGYFEGDVFTKGNVGIGTTEPTMDLTVAGSFYGGTAGGYGISITGTRISPCCGPDGCQFMESDLKLVTEFEGDIILDTKDGEMRITDGGNVGIGTADPQSTLQVDGEPGYLQIDAVDTAPPPADCDSVEERGRMVVDFGSNLLYICNGLPRGWDSVALND